MASYLQKRREAESGAKERVRFLHADARSTGLPSGSCDVVTMCLVAHETPQCAMRELAQEAMRLLRPGGAFCIMEQDHNCEAMRRITANVVAPGVIDTKRGAAAGGRAPGAFDRIPLARPGTVDEIAAMVRLLVGPQGGFITGQCMHVNGGAYLGH